jgi:hypothetical protein
MCIDEGNSMPLPSEIHLLQSMIMFLKEQVLSQLSFLHFPKILFFSSNNDVKVYFKPNVVEISILTNVNYMKMHII